MLVYEPLRWAKALRPEWIACEQVKEVLPIWRQTADELRTMGYSTWCGVLDAASYGTPQHRRRAILMASRVRDVQPPAPTHGKGGSDDLWGYGVEPPVSMAEALGWSNRVDTQHGNAPTFDPTAGPFRTVVRASKDWVVDSGQNSTMGGGKKKRYARSVDRPAMTVTGQSEHQWLLRTPGRSYDAEPRRADLTEPAPTVALGHNASSWWWERPDTTVQGTPRIAPPGHHERQFRDSIPVELWELGVLQDFPRDHPWEAAGTKEAQSRAIGNAIPVRLATAILGALTGQAKEAAA
jgi:DNA (cytosine-5)-methyltransferase 1